MIDVVKAFLAWVVLCVVCINLIGLVVRGFFFRSPVVDVPTDRVAELFAKESRRMAVGSYTYTAFWLVVAVALMFVLHHFWGFWLVVAALMLMAARVPDLLWEIRSGRRVARNDAPQGAIYVLGFALIFLALPVVWYALSGGRWPA